MSVLVAIVFLETNKKMATLCNLETSSYLNSELYHVKNTMLANWQNNGPLSPKIYVFHVLSPEPVCYPPQKKDVHT